MKENGQYERNEGQWNNMSKKNNENDMMKNEENMKWWPALKD